MAIKVTGVNELVLEVLDLERAEHFYSQILGLPIVERWPDREACWVLAGDQTRIGLWRPQVGIAGGRGGIHVHYALHVEEKDYDDVVEQLKAAGQTLEEHTFRNYDNARAVYVDDPDGNVVELWTFNVKSYLT